MKYPKIITAMVTPMTQNLEIDFTATQKLVNHLIATGTDGILVCGTTGESPTLSEREKIDLLRCVQETAQNRVPVIMGIGSNCTNGTIDFLKKINECKPDMILSVVPYYNKPSQEGIYQHFSAVANATDCPIILYNIPGRTGINMAPATVSRLANEFKNIVAIKQSCPDMDAVSTLKQLCPNDFIIYSGDDSLTLPMLSLGASGVVSVASHIAGKQIHTMIDAFTNGDNKTAQETHLALFPIFKGLFMAPNPTPVKKALVINGVIPTDTVRLPLVPITEKETEELKTILNECNI